MLYDNRYYSKALMPQNPSPGAAVPYAHAAKGRIHTDPGMAREDAQPISMAPQLSASKRPVSEVGKPTLPSFNAPATSVQGELQKSIRGRAVAEMMTDASATVDNGPLSRYILDVRGKASTNLRESFAQPDAPSRTNEEGRPTTRTAMLAMRREEMEAANANVGRNRQTILPTGVQPGAPGKRPDATRFTHLDVERNRPVPGR